MIDLQELRNRLGLSDSEYQRVEAFKKTCTRFSNQANQ